MGAGCFVAAAYVRRNFDEIAGRGPSNARNRFKTFVAVGLMGGPIFGLLGGYLLYLIATGAHFAVYTSRPQ